MTLIESRAGVIHRRLCGVWTIRRLWTVAPDEEIVGWLYGRLCRRCFR